jgi:hypothetical protein
LLPGTSPGGVPSVKELFYLRAFLAKKPQRPIYGLPGHGGKILHAFFPYGSLELN